MSKYRGHRDPMTDYGLDNQSKWVAGFQVTAAFIAVSALASSLPAAPPTYRLTCLKDCDYGAPIDLNNNGEILAVVNWQTVICDSSGCSELPYYPLGIDELFALQDDGTVFGRSKQQWHEYEEMGYIFFKWTKDGGYQELFTLMNIPDSAAGYGDKGQSVYNWFEPYETDEFGYPCPTYRLVIYADGEVRWLGECHLDFVAFDVDRSGRVLLKRADWDNWKFVTEIWDGKRKFTEIKPPAGYRQFHPKSMNENGEVVGFLERQNDYGRETAIWDGEDFSKLDNPNLQYDPIDFSDTNEIVGAGWESREGVVWVGGVLFHIRDQISNWEQQFSKFGSFEPLRINNAGTIIGTLRDGEGGRSVGVAQRIHPGDLNCDGSLNFDDIDPFVLVIQNEGEFEIQYPDCRATLADMNDDGAIDFRDIDGFINCLTGECS